MLYKLPDGKVIKTTITNCIDPFTMDKKTMYVASCVGFRNIARNTEDEAYKVMVNQINNI